MKTNVETQLGLFSPETCKELEENRKQAEEKLKYHSGEADKARKILEYLNGLLGVSQNAQATGEMPEYSQNDSALSPTGFVLKLLNEAPGKWISIQEILFKSQSAYNAGEVISKAEVIDRSIHSVLTRFRRTHQVWTKGKRETRKYKLKP